MFTWKQLQGSWLASFRFLIADSFHLFAYTSVICLIKTNQSNYWQIKTVFCLRTWYRKRLNSKNNMHHRVYFFFSTIAFCCITCCCFPCHTMNVAVKTDALQFICVYDDYDLFNFLVFSRLVGRRSERSPPMSDR